MIAVIFGALAGLFHRLYISPFIGKQNMQQASVGTPAAGVILAFVPFRIALGSQLKRIVPDARTRREVETAVSGAYWSVFFAYGVVVVVTILANIGGKKK